jgi:hypothetical protein
MSERLSRLSSILILIIRDNTDWGYFEGFAKESLENTVHDT